MKVQSALIRTWLGTQAARRSQVLLSSWTLLALAAIPARSADQLTPMPEFKEVEAVVNKQLATRRGYRYRDILSQRDVKAIFAPIEKLGWKVAERKQILSAVLGDGDFLVLQLRSRKGVPFMRKLSKSKGTYARLDQLRRLKYGNRRIRELIQSPGGHTLILYMTTTKGGKNLNRQLRRTKNGSNFGRPTKRIYSAVDLLKRLRESHKAEVKRRLPTVKRTKPGQLKTVK